MRWLLMALIACSTTDAAGPPTLPSVPETRPVTPEHGTEAIAARDATIRGDLDAIHAAAAKLEGRLPWPNFPATYDARQAAVKAAAHDAANATNVSDAAEAVGRIAQACGECHAEAGIAPMRSSPPAPDAADGIAGEMSRHKAAAELLWLGLIRPDDQAIKDASALLQAGHITTPGSDGDPNLGQAERELDAGVHELADVMVSNPGGRGAKYGHVLVTCATCHLVTGGGPKSL